MSASYYWRWWRAQQPKVHRATAFRDGQTWIDLVNHIERVSEGTFNHASWPDLRDTDLAEPLPRNNGWDLMTNVR